MRKDLMSLLRKHSKLLFIVITNGSRFSLKSTPIISCVRNLIILTIIEGRKEYTEERWRNGAYQRTLQAMNLVKKTEILYGFTITVTWKNMEEAISETSLNTMRATRRTLGFFTNYVPWEPSLPYSCDNICTGGLQSACSSLFFQHI